MRMRRCHFVLCAGIALSSVAPVRAQTEIRLWPDGAPGSEHWSIPESVTSSPSGDRVIANVSDPTLTVFLPDASVATGAAAVIAPGGALRVLGFDNEGVKVAEWLNERGIAGFVLKYRTLQQDPSAPRGPLPGMPPPGAGRARSSSSSTPMRIRRPATPRSARCSSSPSPTRKRRSGSSAKNASDWRIDPERVGIIGFSAGGGVAVGTALAAKSDASPDFLVSVYGPSLQDVNVPEHAPPLFIAVGSTHFNVTNGCLALFAAWKAAGKPAEIHVYDGVSAGFGMTKRGQPVDAWTDRLYEWLVARELTSLVDPDR